MKYIKLYESYDESNILDYFLDISDDDIDVNVFQGCLGFTTSGYSRIRPTVGISLDQILNILGNLNRMNNMGEFSVTKFKVFFDDKDNNTDNEKLQYQKTFNISDFVPLTLDILIDILWRGDQSTNDVITDLIAYIDGYYIDYIEPFV